MSPLVGDIYRVIGWGFPDVEQLDTALKLVIPRAR